MGPLRERMMAWLTNLRETRSWWRSHSGLTLLGFLVIAGFYLVSEHRAHLFGALPWLLRLQRLVGSDHGNGQLPDCGEMVGLPPAPRGRAT